MGEFSAHEFEDHAKAAFYRPDRSIIKNPKSGDGVPSSSGADKKLPDWMTKEDLAQTEYFKAALFELVMNRAVAFMKATAQETVSDEKKRIAVVNCKILFDTEMFTEHDEKYAGDEPVGYAVMREFTAPGFLNVRVRPAIEWYDSKESLKSLGALSEASLACHIPKQS